DLVSLQNILYMLSGKIPFGNHVHLQLRCFHTVSFAQHRTKCAISAKLGICRDQQVSQIGRLVNLSVLRSDSVDKTFHFSDGVSDQNSLKVVSKTQSVANSTGQRINVFQ